MMGNARSVEEKYYLSSVTVTMILLVPFNGSKV